MTKQHLHVDIRNNMVDWIITQHVAVQIRRNEDRRISGNVRFYRPSKLRQRLSCFMIRIGFLLSIHGYSHFFATYRIHELIREIQSVHRILGIYNHPVIFRTNTRLRKFSCKCSATHHNRDIDAGITQVLRCCYHLLCRLN
ncbi:hypothetical protein D3C78_1192550 [compost metagenome]